MRSSPCCLYLCPYGTGTGVAVVRSVNWLIKRNEQERTKVKGHTSFPFVYTGIFADTLMKSLNLIPLSFFLNVSSAFFNWIAGIR